MIRLNAKNGFKVTEEDVVEEERQRPGGHLLGRARSYWDKFITDAGLDRTGLIEKGYRAEQLPFIEQELKSRGWLG